MEISTYQAKIDRLGGALEYYCDHMTEGSGRPRFNKKKKKKKTKTQTKELHLLWYHNKCALTRRGRSKHSAVPYSATFGQEEPKYEV